MPWGGSQGDRERLGGDPCHAACLSRALIALSGSAANKGSLSSLILPPRGPLLAWHAGGTGAGTDPGHPYHCRGHSHRHPPRTSHTARGPQGGHNVGAQGRQRGCPRGWQAPDRARASRQVPAGAGGARGGLGTRPAAWHGGGFQKPGTRPRHRRPSPASPAWASRGRLREPLCSPEAVGMGTPGCPGRGCLPALRRTGQSLPAPCEAALVPACLSPPALPTGSLAPRCRLRTRHRGGQYGAGGEKGAAPRLPLDGAEPEHGSGGCHTARPRREWGGDHGDPG